MNSSFAPTKPRTFEQMTLADLRSLLVVVSSLVKYTRTDYGEPPNVYSKWFEINGAAVRMEGTLEDWIKYWDQMQDDPEDMMFYRLDAIEAIDTIVREMALSKDRDKYSAEIQHTEEVVQYLTDALDSKDLKAEKDKRAAKNKARYADDDGDDFNDPKTILKRANEELARLDYPCTVRDICYMLQTLALFADETSKLNADKLVASLKENEFEDTECLYMQERSMPERIQFLKAIQDEVGSCDPQDEDPEDPVGTLLTRIVGILTGVFYQV
jgi:hypothetical protein